MLRFIILIVISVIMISCSFNDSYNPIKVNYIIENNNIVTDFKKISSPNITYLSFSDFFQSDNNLDLNKIILNVVILNTGKVDSVEIVCDKVLSENVITEITNNINYWKFEPAKGKSETTYTSSITFNWSDIYSQWKPLLKHPYVSEKYKLDLFLYKPTIIKLIKSVPPDYPLSLKNKGIEGDVFLFVHLTDTGFVDQIIIDKSSDTALNSPTVRSVEQWRFEPIENDVGENVSGWVYFPISFRLG